MNKKIINYQDNDNLLISHILSEDLPKINKHIHDWYEIYYLLSGNLIYYVEGHKYEINDRDMLLINNKELHYPVFNNDSFYERVIIHFKPHYINSITKSFNILKCFEHRKLGRLNRIKYQDAKKYGIQEYIQKIQSYAEEFTPENKVMVETLLIQMLLQVCKIFKTNKKTGSDNISTNKTILNILDYINNNLEQKISLSHIEKHFHINKYHLCHLFKQHTGFTLIEYITYKRTIKAKELLARGYTCTETCHKVGFDDYSHFFRVFKRITGEPPSNFK